MGLKKLLNIMKQSKENRKDYWIKPCIKFWVDTNDYMFVWLPTVIWLPWPCRRPGDSIIEFAWLNMWLGLGKWEVRK